MVKWRSESVMQAREHEIIIDSDEEIDGGFLCLINEKRNGITKNNFFFLSYIQLQFYVGVTHSNPTM